MAQHHCIFVIWVNWAFKTDSAMSGPLLYISRWWFNAHAKISGLQYKHSNTKPTVVKFNLITSYSTLKTKLRMTALTVITTWDFNDSNHWITRVMIGAKARSCMTMFLCVCQHYEHLSHHVQLPQWKCIAFKACSHVHLVNGHAIKSPSFAPFLHFAKQIASIHK